MPIPVTVEFSEALVAVATEAWTRLAADAAELVTSFAPDFRPRNEPVNGGVACCRFEYDLKYRPTCAVLVLGDRFFKAWHRDQTLTMMHELIHLILQWGPLRGRAIESEKLWQAENLRRGPDPTGFEEKRWNEAKLFRLFAEEVLAEQFLQRRRPKGDAAARVSMYRRMREKRAAAVLDVPATLRCFALFYDVVCNDLGASISSEADDRAAFSQLADDLVRRVTNECADGAELLAMRCSLLALDLDQPPYDFSPYDAMWGRVMTLQPLQPSGA